MPLRLVSGLLAALCLAACSVPAQPIDWSRRGPACPAAEQTPYVPPGDPFVAADLPPPATGHMDHGAPGAHGGGHGEGH